MSERRTRNIQQVSARRNIVLEFPRDIVVTHTLALRVDIGCQYFESLERDAELLAVFQPEAMQRMIHRSAELHVEHIACGGDPFESGSARPLDFGHWAAHKLEQLSDYQIRHGEAVAIGLALDVIYSRHIGLLDAASTNRILALLQKLGFDLFASELLRLDAEHQPMILKGLEEFREHLGGQLTLTMLRGLGAGVEVLSTCADIASASASSGSLTAPMESLV